MTKTNLISMYARCINSKMDGAVLFPFGLTLLLFFKVATTSCPCSYSGCISTWASWSPWGSCSRTCGGGVRKRTAICINRLPPWFTSIVVTNVIKTESSYCGENCLNGGSFIEGACSCLPPSKEFCCEKLPACNPICQNGGVCIADDICRCPSNFYGQLCEIGSELEERLQPHFYPAVSKEYDPRSWYDAPSISGDNKICYIKIEVKNAYFDTILTAVSRQADDNDHVFRNFTAAPIDSDSKLNHTSRFACLRVRCPGVMVTDSPLNVAVDVTVTSPRKKCSVRRDGSQKNMIIMTDYDGGHDAVGLELESGNNYGEMYGIYVGTGFRDKAEYLAKQSCYSGNRYLSHSLQPERNVFAKFECI